MCGYWQWSFSVDRIVFDFVVRVLLRRLVKIERRVKLLVLFS